MAKSKNDNCKLRHNTFEKTSVIIKTTTKTRECLVAAKECLRRIALFLDLAKLLLYKYSFREQMRCKK